jgi:steroid 5-alpha reductase family enzyme
MLRSLRPAGSRKRVVPYGFGFNLVTAPNYFFEIIAWVSIFMMTGSLMSECRILSICRATLSFLLSHSTPFRCRWGWTNGDLGN